MNKPLRNAAEEYISLKQDLVSALRAKGYGNAAVLQAYTGFSYEKTRAILLGYRHIDLFDFVVLSRLVDSVVTRIEKGEVAAPPPQVQRGKPVEQKAKPRCRS